MKKVTKLEEKSSGQALLEIAITIGIITVVVAALAITTLIGLRNSQFAQNQVQATKLAQEGLEKVRSMKSRNEPICISGANFDWSDNSSIWNQPFFSSNPISCSPCRATLTTGTSCGSVSAKLNAPQNPEILENGKFQRQIILEDYLTDQKKVTARVTWTDLTGSHQSELVTILAKY